MQKVIVITAPSGSGKSTLVKKLLEENPHLSFSVSACTRAPRQNEVNGKDYHFLAVEQFESLIRLESFVEWEMVYPGSYYGTLKSEMNRLQGEQKIPVIDIDVQGALHVQKLYDQDCLSIFIKAPSLEELRRRLVHRGADNDENIEQRVTKAKYELSFSDNFDCMVVNEDLKIAFNQLQEIVHRFITTGAKCPKTKN